MHRHHHRRRRLTTAQALAHSLQAGQTVAQKRQLGLQLALVGHGTAAENFQNQHGAVNDLQAAEGRGDVADLAAGQLAVKHGTLGTQLRGGSGGLLQLAAAQHDAGLGVCRFWATDATASMWLASQSAASSFRLRSQSQSP